MSTEEIVFSVSFFIDATIAVMLGICVDACWNECHVTDDMLRGKVA